MASEARRREPVPAVRCPNMRELGSMTVPISRVSEELSAAQRLRPASLRRVPIFPRPLSQAVRQRIANPPAPVQIREGPLLCCRYNLPNHDREIRDWLRSQNIPWREDASNANVDYQRNRIRLTEIEI